MVKVGEERDARRGRAIGGEATRSGGGGGGPLDSSWLNARAVDKVGREKRKELLAEARRFLDEVRTDGHAPSMEGREDDDMALNDADG